MTRFKLPSLFFALTISSLFSLTTAQADGFHYTIHAATKFLATPSGELQALQMDWTYEPDVAEFLLEDDDLSEGQKEATLKQRGKDILTDLHDLNYFSQLTINEQAINFAQFQDYSMTLNADGSLTLSYKLPLVAATAIAGKNIALRLADPDGVGELGYDNASKASLDETLAKSCSTPEITTETVTLANEHKPVVPTVKFNCK